MSDAGPTLSSVIVKTAVTHTVTYFIVGLLASTIIDYATFFTQGGLSALMRPVSDPWVMAGPLFQPVRGLLFGGVFWLLREPLFGRERGWLVLWVVLLVLGALNTFGPAPGSIEGMIYTILPLWVHAKGAPELVFQTLLLSVILCFWVNHPERRWINWVMGVAFVVVMTLPILGLTLGQAGR